MLGDALAGITLIGLAVADTVYNVGTICACVAQLIQELILGLGVLQHAANFSACSLSLIWVNYHTSLVCYSLLDLLRSLARRPLALPLLTLDLWPPCPVWHTFTTSCEEHGAGLR